MAPPQRQPRAAAAPAPSAAMAEPAGPFRELLAGPRRFLCYCGPGGGAVQVTDGCEVWAAEPAARPPRGPGEPAGATSQNTSWLSEQHGTKIRKALERGVASLSLHDDGKATLQLQEEAWCSTLELSKLPVTEARNQLQELMFSLVGCVKDLEKRLEVGGTLGSSCSPEKNAARSQQLFMPDPRSRKTRGAGSTLPAKRRIPGESIINPGFKTKKTPGGVDFEDS